MAFSFLLHFVCLSSSEARPLSISMASGLSIHFTGTSSIVVYCGKDSPFSPLIKGRNGLHKEWMQLFYCEVPWFSWKKLADFAVQILLLKLTQQKQPRFLLVSPYQIGFLPTMCRKIRNTGDNESLDQCQNLDFFF